MMWWLILEKKPFQPWREIWIQVVVIVLQLYQRNANHCPTLTTELFYVICFFDHTNYISLGNYCFIVFMGKSIWYFSTKFQNRRLFYFTSLELFAKLTMQYLLKVSKFRKQIMVSKLLPKNKPSSLSWKITTSRLIQKRVYLLAKRT